MHIEKVIPKLTPVIDAVWFSQSRTESPRSQLVMPDASVDLIFKLNPHGIGVFLCGAMTSAKRIPILQDHVFCGVRFRPGVAGLLFDIPMAEIQDQIVELNKFFAHQDKLMDLFGSGRFPMFEGVLIEELEKKIVQRVPQRNLAQVRRMSEVTDGTVATLADQFGRSRRHFTRSFAQTFGLSPREFANIKRFMRFQSLAARQTGLSLSSLAVEAGYYDQAHMAKSIKALCGLTPAELMSQTYKTDSGRGDSLNP